MATAHHLNYEGLVAEHIAKKERIPFNWVWMSPHRAMILKHLHSLGWKLFGTEYTPPAVSLVPYNPHTLV